MSDLARLIAGEIERSGPISVEAFVSRALYDPDHGYYSGRDPIGRQGDFITAPEISQVFGELIGAWVAAVWQSMAAPAPWRLVEIGPGRGSMLADALGVLGRISPTPLAAATVHLVEPSPVLQALQREALAPVRLEYPPLWHGDLDGLPPGPMILVMNEVLDALPPRQWVRVQGRWRERCIDVADAAEPRFAFVAGALIEAEMPCDIEDASDGAIFETCPAAIRLVTTIARRLAAFGGAALIIDYGHRRRGCGETLQAVSSHRHVAPLARPGEVDLTHHVDFQTLKETAIACGAACFGPIPQGLLLGRLGIAVRANALISAAPEKAPAIESAVRRLVHPGRMGDLFKAVAVTHPALPPPPGFAAAAAAAPCAGHPAG